MDGTARSDALPIINMLSQIVSIGLLITVNREGDSEYDNVS